MTQTHHDDGLREEFRRLRSETEGSARVPDFRAMLEKTKADELARPELRVVRGGRRKAAHLRYSKAFASKSILIMLSRQ